MEAALLHLPAQQAHPLGEGGGEALGLRRGQQGVHQGRDGVAAAPLKGLTVQRQGGKAVGQGGVVHAVAALRFLRAGGAASGGQSQQTAQCRDASSHRPTSSPFHCAKLTSKQVPSGSRRRAVTAPPCWSTVSRTMDRPRPVPPAARERALSTR